MKFRRIVLLALVFCLAAVCGASAYEAEIKKMSATMADKIAGTEKAKIAVVDFTNLQGDVTELGRFLAEEFSVALAGAGKGFKVVDRTHLKSIIKENKLSATGLIDPETARKLGQIAGVDALITGTLTPFGDSVRIAVKVLDASSAEVVDAISGNIAKTEAVKELLANNLVLRKVSAGEKRKGKTGESLQVVEADGFTFQLEESRFSNGNIVFSLLITSIDQDRKLGMYGDERSRFFDYNGNEYGGSGVKLGNSSHWGHVTNTLIAGIPVKASLTFKGVSEKIKSVALLDVNCGFHVQFRDILVSK